MSTPARPVPRVEAGAMVLRAFGPADLPDLVRAFADPEIRCWNPGPADGAPGAARWLAERNDWSAGRHASWAVVDRDDALVGSVSVYAVDPDQGDAEVGYWTAPWARGRGAAVAALRAAADYAFGPLRLRRLYLHHAVENVASCAVAERAGFLLEGRLRASYRYGDGRWHDEHLHARLATDRGGPATPAGGGAGRP